MTKRISIVTFIILAFSVNVNAQERGRYVTLDQWKEIHFLDSNKIILTEGFEKEIQGTYKRKIGRLIVYPTSIIIASKSYLSTNLPTEISYKMKNVTGQKFQIKNLSDGSGWDRYFLRSIITFGIE